VLEHGHSKRGYLGIAGQPVRLPDSQRSATGHDEALLVVGVTSGSPAADAGVMIGDVLTDFDGHPVSAPEDLLDLLVGDRVGRPVVLRLLRGGTATNLEVKVGERPAH
jgi:S1-C subfamily serine protease